MSEANKYGQGDNHTMEARIIRNPAAEVAATESEVYVSVLCMDCGAAEGQRCVHSGSFAEADARRRLEPKPDAAGDATEPINCANCGEILYHDGGWRHRDTDMHECMLSAEPAPHSRDQSEWIESVVRDVAELPDRNSPEGWPESMLVTGDELREIITRHYKGGSNA